MSSTFSEVRAGAARISAGPIARNVAFISNLMESGVEFTAVDFPQANRLTVHILAAVAEHEAEIISKRTKEALAAAKRRGVKLGGYHGGCFTEKARKSGPEALKVQAKARAADLKPVIDDIRRNQLRGDRPRASGQKRSDTTRRHLVANAGFETAHADRLTMATIGAFQTTRNASAYLELVSIRAPVIGSDPDYRAQGQIRAHVSIRAPDRPRARP
jgi:hypothetical protein